MAWPYLVKLVVQMIVTAAIGELLRPKIEAKNADAAGLDESQVPTADATRKIPYVAGTVEVSGPNVVWWGDFWAEPVKERAGREGGFLGIGAHTVWQTVGYKYRLGMHLAICKGPATLVQVNSNNKAYFCGDHPPPHVVSSTLSSGPIVNGSTVPGLVESGLFGVSSPDVFGRPQDISFVGNWLPGTDDQEEDAYLKAMIGTDIPAWRGVASVVVYGPTATTTGFRWSYSDGSTWHPAFGWSNAQGMMGLSPAIPDLGFVVRRIPSNLGLASNITNIGNDANPAEVVYELLSDSETGIGMPDELIDLAAFRSVAQTLASENLGISVAWSASTPVKKIIEEVMRTIDGTCYLDFRTGKWTLALARANYNVLTLPRLNTDNCTVESLSETALDETTNEVRVAYKRRLYDANQYTLGYQITDQVAVARDQANIAYQDAVVSQTIDYPFVTSAALADRLAERDLRALSVSLTKVSLVADRTAYQWKVGDCFILDWAPAGLYNIVMRIQQITPGGALTGAVRIEAIRDVFSLGAALYSTPGTSGWEDPIKLPTPCDAIVVEAPYWLAETENPQPMILAKAPNGSCFAYDVAVMRTEDSTYLDKGEGLSFTPVGSLLGAVTTTLTSSITLSASLVLLTQRTAQELRRGQNLAMFETGEVIAFEGFEQNDDGSITLTTVWRGLLDTLPTAHAIGERLWFFSYGMTLTDDTWAVGNTALFKVLPKSRLGTLALARATAISFTITGRASKPYPPGLVLINGLDDVTAITGSAAWTWRHRNRLTQTQIMRQDDASQPTTEGSYTYNVVVGIPSTRFIYTTSGQPAGFFAITGSDGTQAFSVVDRTPGTKIYVVWRADTNDLSIRDTLEVPFEYEVKLWRVDIISKWIPELSAYGGGPANPLDQRVVYTTTTTSSSDTSYTLTPDARIAIAANLLLQTQFSIKTVNGSLESATRLGSPFTMTGFGMGFGTYFGGVQQ